MTVNEKLGYTEAELKQVQDAAALPAAPEVPAWVQQQGGPPAAPLMPTPSPALQTVYPPRPWLHSQPVPLVPDAWNRRDSRSAAERAAARQAEQLQAEARRAAEIYRRLRTPTGPPSGQPIQRPPMPRPPQPHQSRPPTQDPYPVEPDPYPRAPGSPKLRAPGRRRRSERLSQQELIEAEWRREQQGQPHGREWFD